MFAAAAAGRIEQPAPPVRSRRSAQLGRRPAPHGCRPLRSLNHQPACSPASFKSSGERRAITSHAAATRRCVIRRRRLSALRRVALGDSIAVNGVLPHGDAARRRRFAADVSRETLSVTTLGDWQAGHARQSREGAARRADRSAATTSRGHVDGVGTVRPATRRCALPAHGVRACRRRSRATSRARARSASTA